LRSAGDADSCATAAIPSAEMRSIQMRKVVLSISMRWCKEEAYSQVTTLVWRASMATLTRQGFEMRATCTS